MIKLAEETNMLDIKASSLMGKGKVLFKKELYNESLLLTQESYEIFLSIGSDDYHLLLHNIASIKMKIGDIRESLKFFNKCLEYYEKHDMYFNKASLQVMNYTKN
ncbi:tetratricopeptide repeat protein [Salinibacillus kushneri]|uniref:tetratricopeptide repeat protein n=1 Tax=Salinibacillus kushneri TaxID=237682 RepID=UPI000B87F35B|nr:tetratricopeptide repeat protein [Salinibacillus kushneri]